MRDERRQGDGSHAVCTIVVAGFPPDVNWRELKNLCRLCWGFESARAVHDSKGRGSPLLFVKFERGDAAERAMEQLQGFLFDEDAPNEPGLRVEFARREMGIRPGEGRQGERDGDSDGYRGGGGRYNEVESGYEGDYYRRSHRDSDPREAPLPRRDPVYPGRGDGTAPWKRSHYDGKDKSQYGHREARRERSRSRGVLARQEGGGGGGGYQRRQPTGSEEVDTLACRMDGTQKRDLRQFFEECAGYVDIRFNEKVNTCFVKFANHEAALNAMDEAQDAGLGAELARRNMEL
mmetsp:Transcript_29935/g.82162  ORF Transcript_29935/g.82162 Transcript_29935/m.82162 type:complete len:291 (+) Transcript_29935:86-958(+)